jgi:hypothetical protein
MNNHDWVYMWFYMNSLTVGFLLFPALITSLPQISNISRNFSASSHHRLRVKTCPLADLENIWANYVAIRPPRLPNRRRGLTEDLLPLVCTLESVRTATVQY